ncbi:MAG TPA: hypothetical protein VLU25_20745 [Acidobacteriota bacterium]|nr:hypothetical protein [Acidobacteriota bacterium]
MVPLMSLWMPILLAAILVFVMSSIVHMVLGYHKTDFKPVPKEAEAMGALGQLEIPPGDYMMPHAKDMKELQSEAFVKKYSKGPVVIMTVVPPGPPSMGKQLVQWFIYCIVVGIFVAYLTGRALGPGAEYLSVFQIAGCSAFMAYALGMPQDAIWLSRSWTSTFKSMFDGLLYGLVTAGAFGWLWP